MRIFKKIFFQEKGSAIVMVAVTMVALLGFTAFAVDAGYLYFQKRNMQNAADSAAIASAWELPDGDIETVAKDYAAAHAIQTDGVTASAQSGNTEVRVVITNDYPRFFGRIFGSENYVVRAAATAKIAEALANIMPFAPLPGNYTDEIEQLECIDIEDHSLGIDPLLKGFSESSEMNDYFEVEIISDVTVYDHKHNFEYLKGRRIVDTDNESHTYTIDGTAYTVEYDAYDDWIDGASKDRLDDFKNRVKYGESDGASIGIIVGTQRNVGTGGGTSAFGFIDLEGDQGNAGANILAAWIYYGPPTLELGSDLKFNTNAGNMESIFVGYNWEDSMSPIDYLIEQTGGTFFIILPHPSIPIDAVHKDLLWGDFLFAKVQVEDPDNYGCGPNGTYQLVATIIDVYNPLDIDELTDAGIRRIYPFLVD